MSTPSASIVSAHAPTILAPPRGPPVSLMGRRGEWPVYVRVLAASDEQIDDALAIPGTARRGATIACTWDAAPYVLEALGRGPADVDAMRQHVVQRAMVNAALLPGLARYQSLGLPAQTQPHQKDDILMLAAFSGALICEPPRSGKSFTALAADILVDSRKTLIVCPAVVKNVWADEIFRWMPPPPETPVVILEGQSGRKIRIRAVGGEKVLRVPTLRPRLYKRPDIRAGTFGVLSTAQGWHMRWPREFRCDLHPDVVASVPALCPRCQEAFQAVITAARYVIVNYEILGVHEDRTGAGKRRLRLDLRGWARTGLGDWGFDVAIVDEIHLMRGWNTSTRNRENRRNLTLLRTLTRIPRVWGLTGTLYYGFTRDAYWPIQIVTGGLWNPPGFKYMRRYANGRKGEYGYEANGRTSLAETELTARLAGFVRQRTRAEIYASRPAGFAKKQRSILRFDLEADERKKLEHAIVRLAQGRRSLRAKWQGTIALLHRLKRERLRIRWLDELAFGPDTKTLVFCYQKEGARDTFLTLDRMLREERFATRMRQVRARLFLATGTAPVEAVEAVEPAESAEAVEPGQEEHARLKECWAQSADARYAMARQFREHDGAALLVATTDSMPGGLSLLGAQTVYHLDWHTSPGAITQAEDRAYAPDIPGLSIIHCSVRNSLDDHLEELVMGKSETCVKLANEQNAQSILQAMRVDGENRAEVESAQMASVWAKMMSHLNLDSGDED